MTSGNEQAKKRTTGETKRHLEIVGQAMDRSAHELQLLANFYHQHGYTERAQEIYRTILNIRRDINNNAVNDEDKEG